MCGSREGEKCGLCIYHLKHIYATWARRQYQIFSLRLCFFVFFFFFPQKFSFHNASAACTCVPFVALLSVRIIHSLFIYTYIYLVLSAYRKGNAHLYTRALASFLLLLLLLLLLPYKLDSLKKVFGIIIMKNVIEFLYIYIFCLFIRLFILALSRCQMPSEYTAQHKQKTSVNREQKIRCPKRSSNRKIKMLMCINDLIMKCI